MATHLQSSPLHASRTGAVGLSLHFIKRFLGTYLDNVWEDGEYQVAIISVMIFIC